MDNVKEVFQSGGRELQIWKKREVRISPEVLVWSRMERDIYKYLWSHVCSIC